VTVAAPLSIDGLGRDHPEWRVWLGVHRVVRAAVDDASWAAAVPAAPARDGTSVALVTGTTFSVDGRAATRFVDALLQTAGGRPPGTEGTIELLDASVAQDGDRLAAFASAAGIDAGLATALAPLAASPLLQACERAWRGRVAPEWDRAACPVCGALAAVMEARGVERAYRLRCARCGADWRAEPVRCPYCGERDHAKLRGLVAQGTGDLRRVEACTVCLGYVKSVTTLTACAPEDVALLDLATVDLDVAALEHGYARPAPPPPPLATRVAARAGGRLRAFLGGRS
jgi:FdhE protein